MSIGIALGGGAGLGWAHIGVLKVLTDELGLEISAVSGTSIGAIVGGGFAAGRLGQVEDVARSLSLWDMLSLGEMGFGQGAVIGTGKIGEELKRHFGDRLIEDLRIPFAAVSADLFTGEPHVDDAGSLVDAMKASSAIPGLFPAIERGDKLLVDGGIVDPVPVRACRALGAERVIGVNLQGDYIGALERLGISRGKRPNALKSAAAAVRISFKTISSQCLSAHPPDILVNLPVGRFDPSDFTRAADLIKLGADVTRRQVRVVEQAVQADP